MSPEKLDPSGVVIEDRKPSRRDLLKGVLIALGAGVILQPKGGVLAGAFDPEPRRKKKGPKAQAPKTERLGKYNVNKMGSAVPNREKQQTNNVNRVNRTGGRAPKKGIRKDKVFKKADEVPKE